MHLRSMREKQLKLQVCNNSSSDLDTGYEDASYLQYFSVENIWYTLLVNVVSGNGSIEKLKTIIVIIIY